MSNWIWVTLLLSLFASSCPGCSHAASIAWNYAVIIDAGSTGSRAHVFKYYTAAAQHVLLPTVELPEAVHKTTPGLSAYAFDPKTAANSLQPLLKFAKQQVPQQQWRETPIQLMATAGLRLLNNGSAEQIMTEVRELLSSSGFAFKPGAEGARVLTGTEEGLLGWLAINYATGALQAAISPQQQQQQQQSPLGRKDLPTGSSSSSKQGLSTQSGLQGVLELGGGSLQVTFMPRKAPPTAEAAALTLPSLGSGRIFSKSFDGVGLQAAHARWHQQLLLARRGASDPCLPSGYKAPGSKLAGGSNWGACKAGVAKLLPKGGPCLYPRCGLAGTFFPNVDGASFVGLDNFFYTARALGLTEHNPPQPLSLVSLDKAAAAFCGSNWSSFRSKHVKGEHEGADAYMLKVCFSSALILALLGDSGLQLPPQQPLLTASNSINTSSGSSLEVKWPLGVLVLEVLQLGGRALGSRNGTSGHDHPMLRAPGSEEGLDGGAAAAAAVAFCLMMLLLSSCASWVGVGMGSGSSGSSGGGAGSGGGAAAGSWWQLLMSVWPFSGGGIVGGGGNASALMSRGGGAISGVKYTRVRPPSRSAGSEASGRATSPSRPARDSGNTIMLTVMSGAAAAGGSGGSGGSGGGVGVVAGSTAADQRSSNSSGSTANRPGGPTTARQR